MRFVRGAETPSSPKAGLGTQRRLEQGGGAQHQKQRGRGRRATALGRCAMCSCESSLTRQHGRAPGHSGQPAADCGGMALETGSRAVAGGGRTEQQTTLCVWQSHSLGRALLRWHCDHAYTAALSEFVLGRRLEGGAAVLLPTALTQAPPQGWQHAAGSKPAAGAGFPARTAVPRSTYVPFAFACVPRRPPAASLVRGEAGAAGRPAQALNSRCLVAQLPRAPAVCGPPALRRRGARWRLPQPGACAAIAQLAAIGGPRCPPGACNAWPAPPDGRHRIEMSPAAPHQCRHRARAPAGRARPCPQFD